MAAYGEFRMAIVSPALAARRSAKGVHTGDPGHLFPFKADTVTAQSGQVQRQVGPVVAVRLLVAR